MDYKLFDQNSPNYYSVVQNVPTIPFFHRAIGIKRSTGELIYGTLADRGQIAAAAPYIRPYTIQEYKLRRKYCDSALGMIMIDNPAFTRPAVENVRPGIRQFIFTLPTPNPNQPLLTQRSWGATTQVGANVQTVASQAGRHLHSPTSFGRHFGPGMNAPAAGPLGKFARWLGILAGDDLPRKMNLFDVFFEVYVTMESRVPGSHIANTTRAEATRLGLREAWFDNNNGANGRGRTNANPNATPVDLPGLVGTTRPAEGIRALSRAGVANNGHGSYGIVCPDKMMRRRGINQFQINQNLNAAYAQDLNNHNLNFSASASGTTSTLLASAASFYPNILNNANIEQYKQYVMACVAYLVGSGMHTCHEVFYTAALHQNLFYVTGSYQSMLPDLFTRHNLYNQWRQEFLDVVDRKYFA
ncbi:hypothetical protein [Agarilytica rhodophyticola]|uniref:hypothetical protein n=1 Tax=Agarilytica rhodophyticola TaxID=1737490 RepID=UPI000B347774|nr:hypothetical protein [Agarilytica rhodophyticola]